MQDVPEIWAHCRLLTQSSSWKTMPMFPSLASIGPVMSEIIKESLGGLKPKGMKLLSIVFPEQARRVQERF